MELQLTQALTPIQTPQQLPVSKHQLKKLQVIRTLPKNILNSLPNITKMQITGLPLSIAPEQEINEFIDFVFFSINPKYTSNDGLNMAKLSLLTFAKNCTLTFAEMQNAIKMTLKGLLSSDINGKNIKITLFREIDPIKFYEIEFAYTIYRNNNLEQKKGLEIIENALKQTEQEKKEFSEEEKEEFLQKIRKNNKKSEKITKNQKKYDNNK